MIWVSCGRFGLAGSIAAQSSAITNRIDALQAQLDRLVIYGATYAAAASVLIALLAILIAVALGVATYFAFSANRNSRVARSLRAQVTSVEQNSDSLQRLFDQ